MTESSGLQWVDTASDLEIVERFWREANGKWSQVSFGRTVRQMRRRLYKVMLDGLAAQQAQEAPDHD